MRNAVLDKRKALTFLAAIGAMLALSGCATTQYESVPSSSVSTAQHLELGTVVAVRSVTIDGEATNLGQYGGIILGSAVGSTVGRGEGSVIAGAAGAVAGAVIGEKIEKAARSKIAQEITVDLDDGGTIVVVQELKEPVFAQGDRVSLLESRSGHARVRHEDLDVF